MNDTHKLLLAFIEASGFDVEKFVDRTETPISKQSGENMARMGRHTMSDVDLAFDNKGKYKRGDDDCYYLKPSLNVDYKVTKKEE